MLAAAGESSSKSGGSGHLPLCLRYLTRRAELRVPAPEYVIQFVVESLGPGL
jgi:hypothetical protein